MITADDVRAAARVLEGVAHRTPPITSRTHGEHVVLKPECLQRGGAFKFRGAYNKIAALPAGTPVVAFSSGNHAQAVALAAQLHGCHATIVMPQDAPALKLAATRGYGAEVDLTADNPVEAHERLLEYVQETGRTFVHPFDDPVLQAGHGTLGLEVVEDVPDVAAVVVPVGGGGLIAGVASAVDCRVIGVEPEGAPSLSTAIAAGEPVRIEPSTIADGLNAPFTGQSTLDVCRERVDEVVLVTDDEIEDGMRFLYSRAKLACEPAGAAAVAAILAGKVALEDGPTVAVVSGGNADPKIVAGILASR